MNYQLSDSVPSHCQISTPEFNKFTAEIIALRLKEVNLASKSDIGNFVKQTDFNNQIKNVTPNKN